MMKNRTSMADIAAHAGLDNESRASSTASDRSPQTLAAAAIDEAGIRPTDPWAHPPAGDWH